MDFVFISLLLFKIFFISKKYVVPRNIAHLLFPLYKSIEMGQIMPRGRLLRSKKSRQDF